MKEKFEEILNKHGIYEEDIEKILYAVSDMFECMIEKTKEEEPYAINTIYCMQDAAYEVRNLADNLE